jgi:hypothetical protein
MKDQASSLRVLYDQEDLSLTSDLTRSEQTAAARAGAFYLIPLFKFTRLGNLLCQVGISSGGVSLQSR